METLIRKGTAGALFLAATLLLVPVHARSQESSGVARKILIRTEPAYPTLAHSMNIQGVVKVEAQVAPNGTVKSVTVKGGHPMLAQAAVTAVGHWKFEPAPHESKELIEIKFEVR